MKNFSFRKTLMVVWVLLFLSGVTGCNLAASSLQLFFNAPESGSSSVPFDVAPPATVPPIDLVPAF